MASDSIFIDCSTYSFYFLSVLLRLNWQVYTLTDEFRVYDDILGHHCGIIAIVNVVNVTVTHTVNVCMCVCIVRTLKVSLSKIQV